LSIFGGPRSRKPNPTKIQVVAVKLPLKSIPKFRFSARKVKYTITIAVVLSIENLTLAGRAHMFLTVANEGVIGFGGV
jgi:hypothetical protein